MKRKTESSETPEAAELRDAERERARTLDRLNAAHKSANAINGEYNAARSRIESERDRITTDARSHSGGALNVASRDRICRQASVEANEMLLALNHQFRKRIDKANRELRDAQIGDQLARSFLETARERARRAAMRPARLLPSIESLISA